jgi:hypothetical protein
LVSDAANSIARRADGYVSHGSLTALPPIAPAIN